VGVSLSAVVSCCLAAMAAASDCADVPLGMANMRKVYIIRNGEHGSTSNHLNEVGVARAQRVALLWGGYGHLAAKFERPKAIFANYVHKTLNSIEVVAPLASMLGLPVNSTVGRKDDTKAASVILRSLDETGGPVLVAWKREDILELVRDLGCDCGWMRRQKEEVTWPAKDFDRVFVLGFDGMECMTAHIKQEGFVGLLKRHESFLPVLIWSPILAFVVVFLFSWWQKVVDPPPEDDRTRTPLSDPLLRVA